MAQVIPKHRAREYETIFIVHPDTAADGVDQIANRMTGVVDKLDGKLLRAENWGKRRLAYPVAKQPKGIYIFVKYLGYSDMVAEIERNLRMLEPVIKYMTVKVEEDVNPEGRTVGDDDINFVPHYDEPVREKAEEPAAEAKAEVKEEAKAEVKEDAKAEVKEEAKAEVKEEAKAEVKETKEETTEDVKAEEVEKTEE